MSIGNVQIANELRDLGQEYAMAGDKYRSLAFAKAAEVVRSWPEPITDAKQLAKTPGIGAGVMKRIQEFLGTGQLKELQVPTTTGSYVVDPRLAAYQELIGIYGMGPATATKLIELGVSGIQDLVNRFNAGQIQLNEHQQLGIRWYRHFKVRIPREEVQYFGDWLVSIIKYYSPRAQAAIVGSYRRGSPDSGDIDILFSDETKTGGSKVNSTLNQVVTFLQSVGFIRNQLSLGEVKFQGTYLSNYPDPPDPTGRVGFMRKFDIRWVPPESWPTALLHATGSDQFNILIRKAALSQNLQVSEYGLFTRDQVRVPVTSEADVFRLLGLEYLAPEQRSL